MRRILKKILYADDYLVGINQRNLGLVKPHNPRKFFPLAGDKVLAKEILEANHIPVPQTYTVISELWEIESKITEIGNQKSVVIKPANGSGGGGILILFQKEKGIWSTHSGEVYSKSKLKHHIASILFGVYSIGDKDRAIVEYCLSPHRFLTNIYDKGIPDLRIILLNNRPLMAMLRVPTDKSDGKANLHQGAMGIGIDMETGTLTHGFYKGKYVDAHPDSGHYFNGTVIPYWSKTLRMSKDVAKLFPLKYLGVDIIYDQSMGPIVIEVNSRPGLQIQNINKRGLTEVINNENVMV